MSSIYEQYRPVEIATHTLFLSMIVFCVYGNIKIWRRRNEMFMKKRSAAFGLNVACILIITGYESIILNYVYFPFKLIIIPVVVMLFSIWLLFCMLITKNWMNYFQTKWTKYTMQFEWQQIINPKVLTLKSSRTQNWFISKHATYGNQSYMNKLVGTLCGFGFLLTATSNSIMLYMNNSASSGYSLIMIIAGFSNLSCLGTAIIAYIVIIRKTPSFNDGFYIQWENNMHSKILSLFVLTLLTFIVLSVFLENVPVWSISAPFFAMIWCAMNYVSTYCINHKNKCMSDAYLYEQASARKRRPTQEEAVTESITLNLILSNETSVHLFMTHLSMEYSMECLLSYIEFVQFQNYLIESTEETKATTNTGTNNEICYKQTQIKFPSNIPTSAIIQDKEENANDLLSCAKKKAFKLYEKYVRFGAEYELNVSFEERQRMHNFFQNIDSTEVSMKDLFLLFEQTKEDMKMFMNYSFTRFKSTPEWFQRIIPLFSNCGPMSKSEEELIDAIISYMYLHSHNNVRPHLFVFYAGLC